MLPFCLDIIILRPFRQFGISVQGYMCKEMLLPDFLTSDSPSEQRCFSIKQGSWQPDT